MRYNRTKATLQLLRDIEVSLDGRRMFNKILTKEIQRRGISYREAAKEIGVSHTTLYQIQQGRSMDVETAIAICKWANVPIETLVKVEGGRERTLAALDVLLRAQPDLEKAFLEAAEAVENDELSLDDFNEVITFAAYMIQRRRDEHKRSAEGSENPPSTQTHTPDGEKRAKKLSYRLKT